MKSGPILKGLTTSPRVRSAAITIAGSYRRSRRGGKMKVWFFGNDRQKMLYYWLYTPMLFGVDVGSGVGRVSFQYPLIEVWQQSRSMPSILLRQQLRCKFRLRYPVPMNGWKGMMPGDLILTRTILTDITPATPTVGRPRPGRIKLP